MKVLLLNPSYPPVRCGVGDANRRLGEAIMRAGNDVTVVTAAGQSIPAGGTPKVVPALREWNVSEFARNSRLLRHERPDVVICSYPAVLPGRYARLLYLAPPLLRVTLPRARVLYVVHEFARTHAAAQRDLRLAFRFAHEVLAVTEFEAGAIAQRYPFAARKLRVVPIGSNIPALPPGSGAGDGNVFYFGMLEAPDKGFEELLEALVALPGVSLGVSGSLDPHKPYHVTLGERIRALGLDERVHFLGYLDEHEAAGRLHAAGAVALPFRGGSAGNNGSLLAALVNGAAVVTTQGEETPPWLRDGESALLVPPREPEALADALRRVLSSADLEQRLREGARALAPRFDWDAIANEVLRA